MIKAIVFDFFDVFRSDSYKAWLKKNSFERTGAFAEASILSDQGKINGDEFYRRISAEAGWTVTPEELDATAELNQQMVDFARGLRTQYQTCLLSNAPGNFVRRLLAEYDIADIFDDILISGETGLIKPDAESFQNALSIMGIEADEVLFVDDNEVNIKSAQRLGIQSFLFTTVDQLKADLSAANIAF